MKIFGIDEELIKDLLPHWQYYIKQNILVQDNFKKENKDIESNVHWALINTSINSALDRVKREPIDDDKYNFPHASFKKDSIHGFHLNFWDPLCPKLILFLTHGQYRFEISTLKDVDIAKLFIEDFGATKEQMDNLESIKDSLKEESKI